MAHKGIKNQSKFKAPKSFTMQTEDQKASRITSSTHYEGRMIIDNLKPKRGGSVSRSP